MFTVGLHSGGEVVALAKSLHFPVERVDGSDEPGGRTRRCLEDHGHRGAQYAGVGPVVAQGGSQAVVGDAVAAGERDALDEPVQPQAAQVVGHAAAPVLLHGQAHERCRGLAQVPVPEAVRQHPEGEQRGEQGLHPRIAEASRRGALPVDDARPMEVVERSGSDGAVVADFLDAQQASVGGKPDLLEIIEVLQPSADIEWSLPVLRTGCR